MAGTRENLLLQIEDFLAASQLTASEFGKIVLNDPAFVCRLREGKDMRLSTADKITAFIAANRRKRRDHIIGVPEAMPAPRSRRASVAA